MAVFNKNLDGIYIYVTGSGWVLPPPASHAIGGTAHSSDTIANIQSKISDGSLITTAAGEINALTSKASPVANDLLVIEDSADTNKKKKITITSLPAAAPASHAIGGTAHSSDTIANIQSKVSDGSLITTAAGEINALTSKASPVANDLLVIEDSADTNKKKKITITSLPAAAPASHAIGGTAHSSDTIANIQSKVSDGSLITTAAGEINALTSKASPVANDLLVIEDSADTNKKKKITITSLPVVAETDPVFLARSVTTNHYTGFPNRTDSTMSFTDATRKFAIAGAFNVYGNGSLYTPAGAAQLEVVVDNVTGLYWIWYTFPGGVPTLNQSVSPPGFGVCLVALVYYNAATANGSLSDERHWMGRDRLWHEYTHETIGCRYASGLAGTFTNTTFSVASGECYDEDIEILITPAKTTCDVYYKNASTAWVWDSANVTPYKLNGNVMRYNNGNNLADVTNGYFAAMWVFATNKISQPVMVVIGQRIDNTIAQARTNNTPESLVLGTLPSAEMKLLYRVIFEQSGAVVTYRETADYRTASALPISNFTPTQHSSLSNLDYTVANHTGFITEAPAEINSITVKSVPAVADELLIEDSAAAFVKKKITVGSMKQYDTQRFVHQALDYGENSDFPQLYSTVVLSLKSYLVQNFRHNQYDYCYLFQPVANIKWDKSVINVRIYFFGIVAPGATNKVYWGAKAFHVPVNELANFADTDEAYTYVQSTYSTANTMSRCLWTSLPVHITSGAADTEGTIVVKITRNYADALDTYPNTAYSPYAAITFFYTGA
jgi:hypothetical protein